MFIFVLLTDSKRVKVERFAKGIDDGARRARGPQVRHAGPTRLKSGAITVLSNGEAQGIRPPSCHAPLDTKRCPFLHFVQPRRGDKIQYIGSRSKADYIELEVML